MRNKGLIILFTVLCAFAFLVVINSVLFSVQHVYAYCYNYDLSDELSDEIINASQIKKNSNIFLLNKNQTKNSIEDRISNVRIINIEKKFPNTVYINLVKIDEYFKIIYEDNIYYISNNLKITRVESVETALQDNLIELKTKGNLISLNENDKFSTDDIFDLYAMQILIESLECLMIRAEMLHLFNFVDLSKDFIYFKTVTGVYFELQSLENAFEKLQLAYSVYINLNPESNEIKSGTYIITGNSTPIVNYTNENRYVDGI